MKITLLNVWKYFRGFSPKFILYLCIILISNVFCVGQTTVTIGTGTNTTNYTPVYSYYNYNYSQLIYTSSELISNGAMPGQSITAIRFYNNSGTLTNATAWVVYLKSTSKTSFSNTSDWVAVTSADKYFDGTVTSVAGAWMTITLSTPFVWDGSSNLVVAVDENTAGFTSSYVYWRYTATTGNTGIFYNNDNTNPNPLSPLTASGLTSNRNNIQFDFSGSGYTCISPSNISVNNVTSTSAGFSWTAPSSSLANGYNYEIRTSGLAGSGSNGLVNSGSFATGVTTATISGLSATTTYNFFIKSMCSNTDSSLWSNSTSFTTPCGTISSFPYSQGFNTAATIPNCYSVSEGSAGSANHWQSVTSDATHGAGSPSEGTAFMMMNFFSGQTAYNPYYLNFPTFILGSTPKRVKFDVWMGSASGTNSLLFEISTNGGANWTTIGTYSANINNSSSSAPWSSSIIDLSTYVNTNVIFRLKATSNYGSSYCDIGFDNFIIEEIPTPLSGTKTIKSSGGDYSTFTAAINALNSAGVGSGGVTFKVDTAFVSVENCPIITASGTSANPIIFQKNGTGTNPLLKPTGTASTSDAGLTLNGADYVTFDGIDIIENTGSALEYGYYIINNSATNGAQNNSIKNCKIILNRTNTSSKGIYVNAAISATSASGANSGTKIQNVVIENAYNGIYIVGTSSTYPDLNPEISNCTIGSSTLNDIGNGSSAANGIYINYSSGLSVFSNQIRNVSVTSSVNPTGMYLLAIGGTSNVYNNSIHDISNLYTTSSSSGIVYGLRVEVISGAVCNVYNNMLYGFNYALTSANNTQLIRVIASNINSTSTGTSNFYFNSARIDEDAYTSSTVFYMLYGTSNLKNNVFANFSTAGSTSSRYCIYKAGGTLGTCNYNDYYINNSATNCNLAYSSSNQNTLANWQSATGKDANSKNVDPGFLSTTNLHSLSVNLDNLGNAVSTANGDALNVTSDYDGDTRNTSNPDLGADEMTGIVYCNGTPASSTISGNPTICSGNTVNLSLSNTYTDQGITYQWAYSTTSGGNYTNAGTNATYTTSALSTTTYFICTIKCTSSNLSYITDEKTIIVNPIPTATATSTGTMCSGTSLTLNGTTNVGTSYSWIGPNGFTSSLQNPVISQVSSQTEGVYSFTTSANGCTSTTSQLTVSMKPNPTSVTALASITQVCDSLTSFSLNSATNQVITLINPANEGGFESGTTFTSNGWTAVNPGSNYWLMGSLPTTYSSSYCAFISQNGSAYNYNNGVSRTAHLYRDITIPANLANISLSFYWKGSGESNYDRLLIYTAPTSVTPMANIPASASTAISGATLLWTQSSYSQTNYTQATVSLPSSLAGTTFRLIFTWQNDDIGGTSPGAAIDNISLTAASSNSITYSWSSIPSSYTASVQNPTLVTQKVTTKYIVTATNNYGCFDTASTTVATVNGATILTQPVSLTKCSGQSASFNATANGPGVTYQWRKNGTAISSFVNSSAITSTLNITNVANGDAGLYDVVISANCGNPILSDSVTLVVNPIPTATASFTGFACTGSTITLTGTTDIGTSFNWTGPNGFSSSSQNPTIASVSLTNNGIYTYTSTSNSCTSLPSTVNISASASPELIITSTNSILCLGDSTTMTGLMISTASPASYQNPNAVGNPTTDEDLGNITFGSLNNTTSRNSLVGTIGTAAGTAGSYSDFTSFGPYAFQTSKSYSLSVSTLQSTNAYGNAVGVYIDYNHNGVFTDAGEAVYVSSTTTNGAHTETTTITIPTNAMIGLTRMRVMVNEGTISGPNMTLSFGEVEDYMLNIQSASPTGYTFSWSDGNTVVSTTNPLKVSPTMNTNYSLVLTSGNGCADTASNPITVTSGASINQQPTDTAVCYGDSIILKVGAIGQGLTYQWKKNGVDIIPSSNSTAATSNLLLKNLSYSDTAIYTVLVSAGCGTSVLSNMARLKVKSLPTVLATSNSQVCEGSQIQLNASSDSATIFTWSGPNNFISSLQNPIISSATLLDSGTYYVKSIYNFCYSIQSMVHISVNYRPENLIISPTSATICNGNIQNFVASGGNVKPKLLSENFNENTSKFSPLSVSGTPTATKNLTYFSEGTSSYLFKTNSSSADVSFAQTIAISLLNIDSATLTFSHICGTESGYDYGYVQYSKDNGVSWITFPTTSYLGSGTLKNSAVCFDKSSYSEWAGQFATNSSTPGTGPATNLWKTETLKIPIDALTSQFKIRFRMTTDFSTNYFGWLIDNIFIVGQKQSSIVWTPITDLYTNSNATIAYTGGSTSIVYAKPTSSVTYTATATATSNCTNSKSVILNVNTAPSASTTLNNASVCLGDSVQLNISLTGTAPWNLTILEDSTPHTYLGILNTPWTHWVKPSVTTTYSVSSVSDIGCSAASSAQTIVTVNQKPNLSFTGLNTSYCVDANSTNLIGTPTGGTFSGSGISGNYFSPALATPGTYSILYTYSDGNGCSNSTNKSVTVYSKPTVSISGLAASYCLDANAINLNGNPSGGTFSGSGINGSVFTPSVAGIGNHTLKYTYSDANSCTAVDSSVVTINSGANLSFTGLKQSYCADELQSTLVGTPSGGSFSGNGMSGNIFNPLLVSPGTYSITYSYGGGSSCSSVLTKDVTVFAKPIVNFSGLGSAYCVNASGVTLTGFPVNGVFSGNGMSGNVFNPSNANIGVDTIIYTFTDTNGCSNTDSKDVTIKALPIVSFSGLSSSYCSDAANITLIGSPSGGSFSGNGMSGNIFSPSLISASTHSITYTYNDTNSCSNSVTKSVTIHSNPTISFLGLNADYCINGSSSNLVGNPLGGSFSGPGISGNVFNPLTLSPGSHSITYSFLDTNGCSDTSIQIINIHDLPIVSFSGLNPTYEINANTVTLLGNPVGGLFSGDGISGTTFSPSAAGIGFHQINYNFTDTNNCSANSVQFTKVVNSFVCGSISSNQSICYNTTPSTLIGIAPSGGILPYSYQWEYSSDSVNFIEIFGANSLNYSPSTLSNTTYYRLKQTSNNISTVYTNVVKIKVYDNLNAGSISSNQSICYNSIPLPLNGIALNGGDGNSSYQWQRSLDGGNTFTDIVGATNLTYQPIVLTTNRSYRMKQTSLNCGTVYSNVVHITVNPIPIINLISNLSTYFGTDLLLKASVSGGTGNYVYEWSPTDSIVGNSNTDSIRTKILLSQTTFNLKVTDIGNSTNCESVASSNINLIGGSLGVIANSDKNSICVGDSLILEANGSGGTGTYTYSWASNPPGFLSLNKNPKIAPLITTTYTVTINDGYNSSTSSKVIIVNNLPSINLNNISSNYCINELAINLIGSPIGGTFEGNGINTDVFYPANAGVGSHFLTYSFTDENNCTNSDSILVIVKSLPIANAGSDVSITIGQSGATIGTTAVIGYTYLWTPSVGLSDATIAQPIANPLDTTIYILTVTSGTCSAKDTVEVNVKSTFAVGGIVTYDNTVSTPLSGLKLYLHNTSNAIIDSTTTNTLGQYNFNPQLDGNYTVSVVSSIAWGGVSSADKVVILRNTVGVLNPPLSGLRLIAADVNASGVANAADGTVILRRVVGVLSSFVAGDWKFNPDTIHVVGAAVTMNFKGICVGDANGSYIPGAKASNTVNLSKSGSMSVIVGDIVEIPIRVLHNMNTTAVSFFISYPKKSIEVLSIYSNISSTSAMISNIKDGKIYAAWGDLQPFNFQTNDVVFIIKAKVLSTSEPIDLSLFGHNEFADSMTNVFQNVDLSYPELATVVGFSEINLNTIHIYNYPNPSKNQTVINYTLPENGRVVINLYDLNGKLVRCLLNENTSNGKYDIILNTSQFEDGRYNCRLTLFGDQKQYSVSRNIVIMK